MKTLNPIKLTEEEQRVVDMAMDYSERIRSYGPQSNLIKVEDYLARLPEHSHARFLKLINLDALASVVGKSGSTISPITTCLPTPLEDLVPPAHLKSSLKKT